MNPHPNDPKGQIGATKNPLHLIPTAAMTAEAAALKQGAEKYGLNNWRESGVNAMTYVGAILRHLTSWRDGEDVDPDSGISHLGHIRANCAILLDAAHVGKLVDDRPVHRGTANPAYTDAPKDEIRGTFLPWVKCKAWQESGVPEGLPPLPPVPDGFDRWEYRGTGWTNDRRRCNYAHSHENSWIVCETTPHGRRNVHYVEAVKD